jgi:hypothetical protein
MRPTVAIVRLAVAACIVAAVVASGVDSVGSGRLTLFDFCTYFTTQVALVAVVSLVGTAVRLIRGSVPDDWIDRVRLAATTYLVVVAIGRAILAPPWQTTIGYPIAFINVFLNLAVCIYVVVDWILVPDRPALQLGSLGWLILYPLLWNALTFIRGIATGWTPYPLLDPTESPLHIFSFLAETCIGTLVAGALAIGISQVRHADGRGVTAGMPQA